MQRTTIDNIVSDILSQISTTQDREKIELLTQKFIKVIINNNVTNITSYNNITDKGLASIARAIEHSDCNITSLSITSNNITDKGLASIARAIEHSDCSITSLSLNGKNITDEGLASIAKVIDRPDCNITSLSITSNNITDEGVNNLNSALYGNTKIANFYLFSRRITKDGFETLEELMKKNKLTNVSIMDSDKWIPSEEGKKIYEQNRKKINKIFDDFRQLSDKIHILKPKQQEESKEEESKESLQINTSSKIEYYVDDICKIIKEHPDLIQNIFLYPKKVEYHLTKCLAKGHYYRGEIEIRRIDCKIEIGFINYIKESIEDMLENSDIASRVEILRLFDENGMNDLVEKIILNRELGSNHEFDLQQNVMHPHIYKLMHKHGMPSSLSHKGIHPNASELIDIFSRINEESKEIISDKDLGEFYYFLSFVLSPKDEDIIAKILQNNGEFFVDRYFETLEEKEEREMSKKFKSHSIETHTQAEESVEQQEQIADQSNINQDHASGISGESSSMFE
jgi:hypothetical protein